MTAPEVLQKLEMLGTEQTRKTLRRHGAGQNLYGVSFADLGALKKKIKLDHALALELWASGNYDARNLATMIAHPQQATEAMLDGWAHDLENHALADMLAAYAATTTMATTMIERWAPSDHEWTARTGWLVLAHTAKAGNDLPDDYFISYLKTIEQEIHTRKNRVRDAMNTALIGIGVRNTTLHPLALAVASYIGPVVVDHGDTNCKTPDATGSMQKTLSRMNKKKAVN